FLCQHDHGLGAIRDLIAGDAAVPILRIAPLSLGGLPAIRVRKPLRWAVAVVAWASGAKVDVAGVLSDLARDLGRFGKFRRRLRFAFPPYAKLLIVLNVGAARAVIPFPELSGFQNHTFGMPAADHGRE